MADKKITELNALNLLDNADLFAVVDTSAAETKKVSYQTLTNSITGSIPPGLGSTGLGWARYDDQTYTQAAPLVVDHTAEPVKLPNDGGYAIETYKNGSEYYDTVNQKVVMQHEGDVYSMIVTFKARSGNTEQSKMQLSLSSTGATPYDRVSKTLRFSKNNNEWENFYESFHFYADADFVANGNAILISVANTDIEVADTIFFIQKTFCAG